MMIHNWIRGPAAAIGLAAMLAMSAPAEAALVACDSSGGTDLTGKVTGSDGSTSAVSACQFDDSTTNSDAASIANINTSGFFGSTNWEAVSPAQTQVGDGGASGTWDLGTPDFSSFDYLIAFVDGNGTHLIAFLFDEAVLIANAWTDGFWDTPFVEPPFALPGGSTVHDVSHYTIARRETNGGGGVPPPPGEVPEPGVLGLMGLGLLGLGLTAYARRRRVA